MTADQSYFSSNFRIASIGDLTAKDQESTIGVAQVFHQASRYLQRCLGDGGVGKDENSFIIGWSIYGGVYHTTLRFFG